MQRQPRLALVQSPASARVASDPSPPPRLPAKHSPKVICYLFEDWGRQIQPRISPKLALVGMASLSSLKSVQGILENLFQPPHTHTKTSLSGTHISTRWEGFLLTDLSSTQIFLSSHGLAKPQDRWTAKGPLTHPHTAECHQPLHRKTVSSKCPDNSFTLHMSGAFLLRWLLMTWGGREPL